MNKRKILRIISLSVFFLTLLVVIGVLLSILAKELKKEVSEDTPSTQQQSMPEIVTTGHFETDLFRQSFLASQSNNIVNTVISPLSVKMAMAMVTEGANEETLQELQEVLGLDENSKTYYRNLLEDILDQDDIILNIANSTWSMQELQFKPDFMNTLDQYYYAQARSLDFSDPSSVEIINNWVDEKTNGRIDTILDSISSDAIMFLINAIYFNADWTEQFVEDYTQEQIFTLEDGSEIETDLMSMSSDFLYQENDDFQAVQLPYGEGYRFVMRVYLPRENIHISDFVEGLSGSTMREWVDGFEYMEGDLELPKFKTEYSNSFINILEALGITRAFDGYGANFEKMITIDDQNVYISDVRHKTYIDVSEKGTEAAAVTLVEIGVTSFLIVQEERFEMIVNRPFFFTIDDTEMDEILFMGTILNPKE
jgi:serine protease inhibitor